MRCGPPTRQRGRIMAKKRATRPRRRGCPPCVNHFLRSSYLRFLGTLQAIANCTSNQDFLVYCTTNGAAPGYAVQVKSTGSGIGTQSPVFIVGGVANDVITFIMQPGTTSFITLQTSCGTTASIKIA